MVMRLAIDPTGRVADCTVTSSSGSTALDVQSCRIARNRVLFEPARDATGRPVAGDYVLPVRWQLPPGAAGPVDLATGPRLQEELAVEVRIDAAGKVVTCRDLVGGTAPGAARGCATFPVGAKVERGYLRGGRPVGAKIVQRYSREVTPDP